MTDLRQSSPGDAVGPTSPPPSPPRVRTPGRLVMVGLATVAISAVVGIALFINGMGMLASPADPQAVDGIRRVTAEEEGQTFTLFVVGAATTEGCRVTSASGAAVAVTRTAATLRTGGGLGYQARAEFEAPAPGYLDVQCPPGHVYVAPESPVGGSVLSLAAGVLLGLVGVGAGVVMVVLGLVLSATSAARPVSGPHRLPGDGPVPSGWPPP